MNTQALILGTATNVIPKAQQIFSKNLPHSGLTHQDKLRMLAREMASEFVATQGKSAAELTGRVATKVAK